MEICWEDSAEECFPACCCLWHYANTATSKMQVTIEEAKGAQSWKKVMLLREILSDGTEVLIEMHDCYRQTWVQLFWIQNLKTPIFFCLNMLEIWIQTIFEAKWSLRDPAVFQPFCYVSNVALSGWANTAAAVIVHFQIQFSFNILNLNLSWSSPRFQDISDFKLAIGQSHSDWQLLTWNAELKSCNVTHSRL